jgi:hypothetical protein
LLRRAWTVTESQTHAIEAGPDLHELVMQGAKQGRQSTGDPININDRSWLTAKSRQPGKEKVMRTSVRGRAAIVDSA